MLKKKKMVLSTWMGRFKWFFAHTRTNYLSLAVDEKKKKRRKRKEMTPSLGSCEPLVIVFARPFSVGSPRRWSKDGGLSQLSAGATIPRSHRLRAHLRDALIRFLVAPDANSAIVINSIHPLKAAARFPPSTLVSSSLFVQLWLLFRFTASLFTADQVFPEWMTHMDIS